METNIILRNVLTFYTSDLRGDELGVMEVVEEEQNEDDESGKGEEEEKEEDEGCYAMREPRTKMKSGCETKTRPYVLHASFTNSPFRHFYLSFPIL